MGFVNQETYQHTTWDAVTKNPEAIKAKYGRWIWGHDAEAYAYENYGNVLRSLVDKGVKFVNTNIPPGYVVKGWSFEELIEKRNEGRELEMVGDWS